MGIDAVLQDGRKVRIGFQHQKNSRGQRQTVCRIFELGDPEDIPPFDLVTAQVTCHPTDLYVKAVGREEAMKKALDPETSGFGREDRRRIWEAFHARKPERSNPFAEGRLHGTADTLAAATRMGASEELIKRTLMFLGLPEDKAEQGATISRDSQLRLEDLIGMSHASTA